MTKEVDFKEFRQRIGDLRGREYWRSLEELSRSDAFDEFFAQEFPQQAIALEKGLDRRNFMKLMGASVALGGLAACQGPIEKIVPYVNQPENLIPGKPLFFASAMTLGGSAAGVLVESHMGRPTKIEGNPDHPSSLGATDAFMQASILGLYDPDRSQVVRHLGEIATWSDFLAALQPILKTAASAPGSVRLLTQTISSPTLGAQIQQLLTQQPGIRWHQWEPASRDNTREGLRMAFGGYVNAVYHLDKANVIVSLDSDLIDCGAGHLRYARDFSNRRRVRHDSTSINRLYAIETTPSGSGAVADHRFPVRPSEVETWARGILAALSGAPALLPAVGTIAKDLLANRGAAVVVAGDSQPPVVHAIAMAINQAIGAIGTTVTITDSLETGPTNQLESLRQLVTDINAGAVKALIMIGGNPAFDAPADFDFAHAMAKVPFRAHQSLYYDETSMLCHWHIPETHFLEAWSDARGHDGTISIVQPLIAPLYNGRSPHELLGALLGGMDVSPYDAVRDYWKTKFPMNFEATWRKWLLDGVIAGSALPARSAAAAAAPAATGDRRPVTGIELQIKEDPTIYDGRFANNAWLQELPKPQTKITWDNVLIISQKTARDIGYDDELRSSMVNEKRTRRVKLTYRGRSITVPLWVVPGYPDGAATLHYGYGRERGGKVAAGTGVNVYPLRFSDALHGGGGAQIELASREAYPIACTQEHQSLNPKDVGDRPIIHEATFAEYRKDPHVIHEHDLGAESMYPPYAYKDHAWAMVIDPSVCTGCNGCVVACVAENNIPMVGKDQVVHEREMHWLRIDRYYKGPVENPTIYHQPVPCMQCENAPCEPVCPVEATSHSGDGLNDMTYNRCVGTRYCSNNCPYKVRRFNFYHYSDYDTQALKPMRNPDVTIRTRGVMEKCTYCVQRINHAKIEAEKEDRLVRDGEVTTACQQACPTQAIVFGNMNDPESQVAKLKKEPAHYALLAELNTRPRTTYLAVVKNPNPEIKG
jgi:molybdopterin-containing oxidoreductase family iron-sulfur binding subunit